MRSVFDAGADVIHFDVMDSHYVPNRLLDPWYVGSSDHGIEAPIDVHLMVTPVDQLIVDFAKAGAYITFHPEATAHRSLTAAGSGSWLSVGSGIQSGNAGGLLNILWIKPMSFC